MFDKGSNKSHLIVRIQDGDLVYDEKHKKYYHKVDLLKNGKFRYEQIDIKMNDLESAFLSYISDDKKWDDIVSLSNMDCDDFHKLSEIHKIHRKIGNDSFYESINMQDIN
jgi:hypothetical protein